MVTYALFFINNSKITVTTLLSVKASGLIRAHGTSHDLAWFLHWSHLSPPRATCTCCIMPQMCAPAPDPWHLFSVLCQALPPKSSMAHSLTSFKPAQMSPFQ